MKSKSKTRSKRRTQEERSSTTKRNLLDATVECIAARGFAGTTIPLIANYAGVTTGAVQHHFGSREKLLIAVVEDFSVKLWTGTGSDICQSPVSERVATACRELWEMFGSKHFLSVLEILLGFRSEPKVFSILLRKMQKIEADLDSRWIALFADCGSKDSLAALRHVMQGTLRGLAIRRIYRKEPTTWSKEITILEQMVSQWLTPPP